MQMGFMVFNGNDLNFCKCLKFFIIKCQEETNGREQSASQEITSDPFFCPLTGGEEGGEKTEAERDFCRHQGFPQVITKDNARC